MTNRKKHKIMTLDRIAANSQREFLRLDRKIEGVLEEVKRVRLDIVEEVRKESIKTIESNDRVVTRLDRLLKEDAAHTERHRRTDDRLDEHDHRIKKLERVKG